uniref:Putative secreted protein n=1 Tax=Anopheles darlingi TaxID=43151 RepID=A0A2M4DPP0_ANODA
MAQFMLVVVLMGSYHLTVSWFVFFFRRDYLSHGLSHSRYGRQTKHKKTNLDTITRKKENVTSHETKAFALWTDEGRMLVLMMPATCTFSFKPNGWRHCRPSQRLLDSLTIFWVIFLT